MRLDYIDIAKGIGIILVVIGHCMGWEPGFKFIYSFHMPLFFFLSGFCLNINKYTTQELFINRLKTILLPALLFSIVVSTLYYLGADGDISELTYRLPWAMWFLPVLFVAEIIYSILFKLLKGDVSKLCISLLSASLVGHLLYIHNISIAYMMSTVPAALAFLGCGNILKEKVKIFIQTMNSPLIWAIVFFLVDIILIYLYKLRTAMVYNSLTPLYESYVAAFCGIMGILCISMHLTKHILFLKNLIIYLGRNTLVIMCTHQFVSCMLSYHIHSMFDCHLGYKIVEQAAIWGVAISCAYLINNKAKWILGKW